jgi:hypothetical protein
MAKCLGIERERRDCMCGPKVPKVWRNTITAKTSKMDCWAWHAHGCMGQRLRRQFSAISISVTNATARNAPRFKPPARQRQVSGKPLIPRRSAIL